jgi:hypothetical protein
MKSRDAVIDVLCAAASAGMIEAASQMETPVTPGEALSAHFTLCRRAIRAVMTGTKGQALADNRSVIIDTLMLLFKETEGTTN